VLNEHHRRHLLASCRYVDRLLSDIDNILTAADSGSPFSRYTNDLSPALRRVLRDYFTRLRADMLRILDQQHAMPEERPFSTVHSIRTALGFVEISIEELKPEYMRGYGEVPAALVPEINGLVEELQSVVRTLDQALAQGEAGDLHERLARLERAGADVSVLAALERVIADQGLVEFRPALDTALARLEDQRFEIAVFGRVSSGKSSLLNHLLGQPVLPVGVTPITAVPTRVMHGTTAEVEVQFADRRPERTGLERLHEFVTEQDNPANAKHVTRLVVRVPARRLSDGIVFVDTPGLGSLATSGAAETLAYLPRCDLGVVLIDAAATLTPDDVATVHRLNDAAIPAMVIMSKADLLDAPDLERAQLYAGDQLSRDLGVRIGVHAVSVMPSHQRLLDTWIDDELRPLLARHRELARQSVQRKIGALRTGVEATLRARMARQRAGAGTGGDLVADASKIEQQLRTASGAFDDVRRAIDILGDVRDIDVETTIRRIAAIVTDTLLTEPASGPAATMVAHALVTVSNDTAQRLTRMLATLADNSRRALTDAAHALDLPDPATDDEWRSLMRELPQADPGPLAVQLRLPLLGLFGRRVATARVRGALRTQVGAQIGGALETHARLLRSWGARALTRLRQQFDAQAQIYRAQLAGALAGPSIDAGTERALQELQGTTASPTPSG
jgi:GTP-binding protein EngB required for normal cell division